MCDACTHAWVLDEVRSELYEQNAKWGEQNHPDGTDGSARWCADASRRAADEATKAGTLTWAHILDEEFWEALTETDPKKLREELIQVAAVAVAWVEAIDRRTG